MNKVLAMLALIALIAVSGLFFFAGFFTGSTVRLTPAEQKKVVENLDKVSVSDVEKTIQTESISLSEKIKKILDTKYKELPKRRSFRLENEEERLKKLRNTQFYILKKINVKE